GLAADVGDGDLHGSQRSSIRRRLVGQGPARSARRETGMSESSLTLRWQLLILVLAVGFVIWLLAPVLTPFAVGAAFAYLFDPLVDRLERLRLSRGLATSIVFVALLLLLILITLQVVPYLQRQVTTLVGKLPQLIEWLQNDAVAWLNAKFGLELE